GGHSLTFPPRAVRRKGSPATAAGRLRSRSVPAVRPQSASGSWLLSSLVCAANSAGRSAGGANKAQGSPLKNGFRPPKARRPGGVRSQGETPGHSSNTRPPSISLPLGGPESFLRLVTSPRAARSNRLKVFFFTSYWRQP